MIYRLRKPIAFTQIENSQNRSAFIADRSISFFAYCNGLKKLLRQSNLVAIQAQSAALACDGSYPQTQLVGSSSSFIASLLNSLVADLQLQPAPTLGALNHNATRDGSEGGCGQVQSRSS